MRFLSTRVHGAVDYLTGALLIISPWLFGFASLGWLPHVAIGAFEVVVSLVTRTCPGIDPSRQAQGTAA